MPRKPINRSEESRARRAAYNRARRAADPRVWKKPRVESTPLPDLFPDLKRGSVFSFWSEELAKDLRQERIRAELEGVDADEAVTTYRVRETIWNAITCPLYDTSDD